MPFYDYECETCKETFEVLQGVNDEPLKKCNKDICPKEKEGGILHKVVTNMNFHLYGSGFYSTDNKRKYLK